MKKAENEETYWTACQECQGRGKKSRRLRKKARLRYQAELEEFEKTNPTEIEWKEWYKNNPFLSELEQLSKKTPTEEIAGASS